MGTDTPAADRDNPAAAEGGKDKVDTVPLVGLCFGYWCLDIPPKVVGGTPVGADNLEEVVDNHKPAAEASEIASAFLHGAVVVVEDNHLET